MKMKHYCPYCMTPVPENESCSVCGLTSGTYIPSPHHLPPGTVLMDRYLVGRVLGEGGFGITYIGCDLRLELKVAIKEYYPVDRATRNASASLEVTNFIGPSAKSYERGKHKFLSEAQVMARLDKQQVIVSVRDFFEINNTAYIVMEYVEGITFRELVEKKGGKIAPEELFPMVEPLFHALTIIHENGLIHRDISPDNLMLENGKIRLLDFGCAREAARGTETMTIALKHGYAPIEQYQQKGQGPWTDIYALSATIYYCLTGKIPPQALDRITEDELLLPSKLGVHLSAGQEKALLKGMKLQPSRRFSSAEEMWRAIYTETDAAEEENTDDNTAIPTPPDTEKPADIHKPFAEEIDPDEDIAPTGYGTKECAEEQTDVTATDTKKWKFDVGQNKKLLCGVGAAAACILVIAVAWLNRSPAEKNEIVESTETNLVENTVENESERETETDTLIAESGLFDNAIHFTSGDDQELDRLLTDQFVKAIVIDCDNVYTNQGTVTKPVLVSAESHWAADSITVSGEGYLQVDGTLDMDTAGYLRLTGDTLRLNVTDGGVFFADSVFVWMDDAACFSMAEGQTRHQLVFSEDFFEGDNVCSVTDFASLQKAVGRRKPVSIDADITLEDHLDFFAPVRISEGVTVSTINGTESYGFALFAGTVLLNDGSLGGNLSVYDGGAVINRGALAMSVQDMERSPFPSLWVEDTSAVVNFGTVDAGDVSRFLKDSLFVNMGELNCYDFFLIGGDMSNLGAVMVSGQKSQFDIKNAGRFWNKPGGTVTVWDAAELHNDSYINNLGEFVVGYDGHFYNTMFNNTGVFRAEKRSSLDWNRESVYYGDGIYELSSDADVKIHQTTYDNAGAQEHLAEVTDEAGLLAALEAPEVEAVCVKADITAHTDVVLRKQLFVDSDCSLTMADSASLTGYGEDIILQQNASLQGSSITLTEDAQLRMEDGSNLIVDEGGALTLDNSILWGWGGNIQMNGASFLLKNRAGAAFESVSSLALYDSEITLQEQGVLALPLRYFDKMDIDSSTITLSDEGKQPCVYVVSDMVLENCTLNVEGGIFHNAAANLSFRNCAVTVGPDGELSNTLSNLSLISGTTLYNEGFFEVLTWDEYLFTLNGTAVNKGTMDLNVRMDLVQPIDNQGTVRYNGSHYRGVGTEWDDTVLTGNPAVDKEVPQ